MLVVLACGLVAIIVAPLATDGPGTTAKPIREPLAFDGFPGPETRGAYLEYWNVHPYAGHCPYAYLVRGSFSFQLPELWELWLWFADNPREPPPGVEVVWQGFPWLLPYGPHTSGVPEDPFDGLAIAGVFDSSSGGSPSYRFQPEGDSAYASRHLVRASERLRNAFLLDDLMCL